MGDMGDDFRAMREYSKQKRASNRENGEAILQARSVRYSIHNDGAHLVIRNDAWEQIADFWPGTGKYKLRDGSEYKRGVFNLLKDLGK